MSSSLNMIDAVLLPVLVDCKETERMYLYLTDMFMERAQICIWVKSLWEWSHCFSLANPLTLAIRVGKRYG